MFNSELINYLRDNAHTILCDYLTQAEYFEHDLQSMADDEEKDFAEELFSTSEEFREYVEDGFQNTEDAYQASREEYAY